MDNAAIDTERAGLWKTMHKLEQMIHISKTPRQAARGQGQRARRDRPGQGQGDPRERAVLHPPAHDRPADADGGDGAGLSRARPGQEEQCRAGEGRRPRIDHHRLRAAHRGDRRPGDDATRSWCWSRSPRSTRPPPGMIDIDRRDAAHADRRDPRAGGLVDHPAGDAAARVPEHLRHDGPDRPVQAPGARQHEADGRHALGNEVEKSKGYIARAEGVNQAKLEGATSPFTPIESK